MNTTPIEFMAWDKDNECLDVINLTESIESTVESLESFCDYFHDNYFKDNPQYLMQLTALRSINNEPIYNHMIVRETYNEYHYLVDMFNYSLMDYLSKSRLEIVGNKFQHPELLELCK